MNKDRQILLTKLKTVLTEIINESVLAGFRFGIEATKVDEKEYITLIQPLMLKLNDKIKKITEKLENEIITD